MKIVLTNLDVLSLMLLGWLNKKWLDNFVLFHLLTFRLENLLQHLNFGSTFHFSYGDDTSSLACHLPCAHYDNIVMLLHLCFFSSLLFSSLLRSNLFSDLALSFPVTKRHKIFSKFLCLPTFPVLIIIMATCSSVILLLQRHSLLNFVSPVLLSSLRCPLIITSTVLYSLCLSL